jgi:CheY-like chemotaxis protein
MLEQTRAVSSELLSGASIRNDEIDSIVVSADLRVVETISALKAISAKMIRVPKRIFLIEQRTRLATLQAYALGATHVLTQPVSQLQLLKQLAGADAPPIAPSEPSSGGQQAASAGAASIASMFSAVISGTPIDAAGARAPAARSPTALPRTAWPTG